jgi:cobB protein
MKPKLAILTGAGMSAESGFSTFRDKGGLWETHPVEQVATTEGWAADPELVNNFYNGLRRQLVAAAPNAGHRLLAEMERDYEMTIITQNVDDLHERAGSGRVIHLHGELMKACSSADPADPRHRITLPADHLDIVAGQRAGDGSLLRPFIVWFGEPVPLISQAAEVVSQADALVIIGTSLAVYPAAGLIDAARADAPIFLIDPNEVPTPRHRHVRLIRDVASRGVATLREELRQLPLFQTP